MKKLSLLILVSICMFNTINAYNVSTITIDNNTLYPINVGMQSKYRENLRTRHDTTGKSGLTIAPSETASWRHKGSIQNITVININNMNKSSIDETPIEHKTFNGVPIEIEYATIIDDIKNPGTPIIKSGEYKTLPHAVSIRPDQCSVSDTIDPTITRNIAVIGAQGVLVQSCGAGDGCYCKSWNKKNNREMPLTPVSKNTDGTYTLLSQNGYAQYYLADAHGSLIEGTAQLSNNFANATTWTFVDGSPNNIITNIDTSTAPTQSAQ